MRRDWLVAAGLYLATVAVYLRTLCAWVYVEGSGELIGAAWWLGTPHPTGYPLYVLLARSVALLLPIASPAAAVNGATALLSAGAAPVFYLLLRQRALPRASAASAACLLVSGRTFWSQAVVAEVYGLFVLVSVLLLAVCLKARDAGSSRGRWLLLSGYVGGLAATCHLQAVLLLPSALGVALWRGRKHLVGLAGDTSRLLVGGAGGASLLLYLLVRNDIGPGFHWGSLGTTGELYDHVTGALYQASFVLPPSPVLLAALARLGGQLASEWPAFLLPAGVWGTAVAWRRDRPFAVAVLGAAALNLTAGVVYHRDPAGIHVFFLLLLTCACATMGAGLGDLERRLRRRMSSVVPALIILSPGVTTVAANWDTNDRSGANLPELYGRQVLQELPPDTVLLTDGDDASYIVDYLHRVEGVRPDVRIFHRMGRGTDMAVGTGPESARARRRRHSEASLLSSDQVVHFLVARNMPARGFRFSPRGLSYRAMRVGEAALPDTSPAPTALLSEAGVVDDPWVDKLRANCWYMEAEALKQQGRSRLAADRYSQAGRAAPRSRSMNYNVGLQLLRLNELEAAAGFVMKAIDIDPARSGPYELAASILTRLGRHAEVQQVHKRASKWAYIP